MTIITGGELGANVMAGNQEQVVKYIKNFLKYARWSRDRSPKSLTYHDYKHFGEVTIKGSQTDLDTIDKLIIEEFGLGDE